MLEVVQLMSAGAAEWVRESSRGGNLGGKTNIIIDEHQTNDQRNPWFIYSHRPALEVGEGPLESGGVIH